MNRFGGTVLALLICVFVGCAKSDSNITAKALKFPISISRETTWVTEPTRTDGSIDFVAAWNEWGAEQSPQHQNIILKVIEICDETVYRSESTQEVLRHFSKPPNDMARRPLRGIADVEADVLAQFRNRVWLSSDNPHLANCLRDNTDAFEAVKNLVAQPGYFLPAIESEGLPKHFVFADLSLLVEMGHLVDLLAVRATWNFGELRSDVGFQDLLTIHQLVRTVVEHGHPLEIVTARKWEVAALDAERTLLRDSSLSRENKTGVATFRAGWEPPIPSASVVVNFTRLSTLAVYCELARKDPIAIEAIMNEYTTEKDFMGQVWSDLPITDWNPGAKLIVAQFNQLDSAFAQAEVSERKQRVARWEQQLAGYVKEFREKVRSLASPGASSSEIDSEDLAKLVLGLTVPSLPMLFDMQEQSLKDHEELRASWEALDY